MEGNEDGCSLFLVADWKVDPSTNRLDRAGESVKLEPKVMAVLIYLAGRPDQTVSRKELEASVWTGTVVSYDAVTGAIQKLRKVFDDDRANPRFIETLSKKGYRLIAPVSRLETATPPGGGQPSAKESLPERRFSLTARIAIVAIVILVAVGAFVWVKNQPPTIDTTADAAKPKTIAVLPFRNLSTDPARDYFAEGVTDDLISSLARFSDLQVIARDSTFFYKDTPMGVRDLAEKLNARYLLRGSVRRAENQLRITAELTDTYSESTLWAERYDNDVSRLFELQDRITHRIVAAIVGQLNVQDRQELSRPRTKNLQAYDHFLYGRQQFFMYANAEKNRKARESFQQAIALDPNLALAQAMLAWTHAFDAMNGWSASREESLERARALAGKAIELDEAMPVAYFVRGLAYRELGDRAHALVEAQKAIEYDPNYAGAHVLLATLQYFNGEAQEALRLLTRAIALNPNHPYNYSFHLGQAHYILGGYDEAIAAFERVLESNPATERAHLWLAAAYAQVGRGDDAEWEMEQVLSADPDVSEERIRDSYPFTDPVDLAHLVDGLRKAGLSQ